MFFIPIFVAIGLGVFLLIADGLCTRAVRKSKARLESYRHTEIQLGDDAVIVTYVDRGKGDAVLSIHGVCGGYDQGLETAWHLASGYRVIAPSRFGYLGSGVPADPGPKAQAKIFAELLDSLGVDRVCLLAASAGGAAAIRFALDYPERTRGLVLYSALAPAPSAASLRGKARRRPNGAGLPTFLYNNFGMWLASLFFKPALSIEREAVYTMLPVTERREGLVNDAKITNPDMARNPDDYPIENLQAPVLVFHAKNDKMAGYRQMAQAVFRFPDNTFVTFETGGHFLYGNSEEIAAAEKAFFERLQEGE